MKITTTEKAEEQNCRTAAQIIASMFPRETAQEELFCCGKPGLLVCRLTCDLEQEARTAAACFVMYRLTNARAKIFWFILQYLLVSNICT